MAPSKMQVAFRKVLPQKCNITFFRSLEISEGPILNVTYMFEGADSMFFFTKCKLHFGEVPSQNARDPVHR